MERSVLLPDTHAHLDADVFDGELDAIVQRARQHGIDRILAVGSDLASSRRAIELAQHYDIVYAAVGIHPHEASRFAAEAEQVRALLTEHKVVAVGEIGLDYYRYPQTRLAQLAAFREQLRWAREANLPVSIHNRDADEDIVRALREMRVSAVLHCFSGSLELAQAALAAGGYISFAGNLTFPKASELRLIAQSVSLDRVLVETDAPVLAPQPWRGRRNEPAYVVATAEVLADLHHVPLSTVASQVTQNADELFAWRAA